jgi:hypothetical protein
MKENRNLTERRQNKRAYVQKPIVGILNSDEPVIIGSISDISLGGVKYIFELRMAPNDNPINSIDLIADNHCLFDIPCAYAWNDTVETGSNFKLTDLRQCGIQFGDMTPDQISLLRNFINRCASFEIKDITSNNSMNSQLTALSFHFLL